MSKESTKEFKRDLKAIVKELDLQQQNLSEVQYYLDDENDILEEAHQSISDAIGSIEEVLEKK
ncbi:hypothetical protein LCGC14_2385000 [marine sediment metagenome]|uniref:Uncharacterized protein n=1 Tax=marine sediment metagenome TaxID=412755 RepID=A0A0F9CLZ8_9ZZZZ